MDWYFDIVCYVVVEVLLLMCGESNDEVLCECVVELCI